MRHRWWFVLAVLLQIAVLLAMVGMKWSTLNYGTKVLLKTRQVDPWDVFRGDYLTLNLEITSLDLNKVAHGDELFKQNEEVFVALQPDPEGRYWTAKSVSHVKPVDGSLFIKGRVPYEPYLTELHVDYGIDSYYVPQHQGLKVDRRAVLEAEVSVDRSGGSALSRLLVNGEEIQFQ